LRLDARPTSMLLEHRGLPVAEEYCGATAKNGYPKTGPSTDFGYRAYSIAELNLDSGFPTQYA